MFVTEGDSRSSAQYLYSNGRREEEKKRFSDGRIGRRVGEKGANAVDGGSGGSGERVVLRRHVSIKAVLHLPPFHPRLLLSSIRLWALIDRQQQSTPACPASGHQ